MKRIIFKVSFWAAWVAQEIKNLFLPEEKRRTVMELEIPDDVYQLLQEEARQRNVSLDTVINDALKCAICEAEKAQATEEKTKQRPKRNKKQ